MLDLVWIIPALPLLGFVILLLSGKRIGEPLAGWLGTAMVAGSFLASVGVFLSFRGADELVREEGHTRNLFTWLPAGGLQLKAALLVDPLSITMMLFVTGIATLIHLFAIGYMHGDPRFPRFFTYLNLFVFSMLMLILGDSFLLMFLGWEGVGTCSYLLISFWFERNSAASAGKKAFVTNRVGDFGLMTAMFLIFNATGSLTYHEVFAARSDFSKAAITGTCLLLFLGACGKSAQLPLYVWLPDAMEGPTPVSALIHAATMVTAGVYLMVRVHPLLDLAEPWVPKLIAWVGVGTALFAASIAVAQDDIKRVLAYSTISQLGYMFLAVGVRANNAAIFHMVTHAFFKALMFLGAGSVIHGMHHEQDTKRMGNLRKWMPITFGTYLIGWLAICGIPPFSGFFSKDDILAGAFAQNRLLWLVGLLTALLTAYYMSRQFFLVFFGRERFLHGGAHAGFAGADEHGNDMGMHHEPHESPWTMTLPLGVLALFSLGAGVLNLPSWMPHGIAEQLTHWLEPAIGAHELHLSKGRLLGLALGATGAAVLGISLAANKWINWRPGHQRDLEPPLLKNAYGIDGLYSAVIEKPGRKLSDLLAFTFDKQVLDGTVNGSGKLALMLGGGLRRLSTGFVRQYALVLLGGVCALLGFALFRTMVG